MSQAPADTVSEALEQLLGLMRPFYGNKEVVLEGATYDAIIDGLTGIRRMAIHTERQLGAFQTLEAQRFARGTMEEVATDAAGALVLDPEGKVVQGNFGRRS